MVTFQCYVERQNPTMRMSIRRFTRLTNAFSKKLENHSGAVALHYMHYNFARIYRPLRVNASDGRGPGGSRGGASRKKSSACWRSPKGLPRSAFLNTLRL